jgi:hypothetical protein
MWDKWDKKGKKDYRKKSSFFRKTFHLLPNLTLAQVIVQAKFQQRGIRLEGKANEKGSAASRSDTMRPRSRRHQQRACQQQAMLGSMRAPKMVNERGDPR